MANENCLSEPSVRRLSLSSGSNQSVGTKTLTSNLSNSDQYSALAHRCSTFSLHSHDTTDSRVFQPTLGTYQTTYPLDFDSKPCGSTAQNLGLMANSKPCKQRRRIIFKNGDLNIVREKLSERHRRYLADIVTTLVDIRWRWTLSVFTLSFFLSWLLFAFLWWLIMLLHGDFVERHDDAERNPCVAKVENFAGCFLFSVETQHTIGYGHRHITDECPHAVFLLCLQSIVGLIIQALMVSVVFAKLARPKKRAQTLMFSKRAVVCQQDGQLCLMFRVGNMRATTLIGARVKAYLVTKRVTMEGEVIQFDVTPLHLMPKSLLFIWPITLIHVLNECSPLYTLSAQSLVYGSRFEIVVLLEGNTESTAMTTQARTSYTPCEVLWGHRFQPVVGFRQESGQYWVDYSQFDSTTVVQTQLLSAAEMAARRTTRGDGAVRFTIDDQDTTRTSMESGVPLLAPSGSRLRQASTTNMNNFQLLRRQSEET